MIRGVFNNMISVVTPCLNIISDGREEFFRKMMESVHCQTYRGIEHIIVDNGSTDGTLEVIKEYYKKGWVDELINENKKGIYQAINAGLAAVNGKYVVIMNTDDYYVNNDYLLKAMEVLENEDFDFVHADRIIKSRIGKPDIIKKGDERVAYFRMPFRHQTMVVKKSVFEEIGFFDESYKICADFAWVLRLLSVKKHGFYFAQTELVSLDGGASSNREKCIEEASRVLFEAYGRPAGLNLEDCRQIYLRDISDELFRKIEMGIKDKKILDSLSYCRELSSSF
jgi:glycosyltransferase involved in cell wall biosynthesis